MSFQFPIKWGRRNSFSFEKECKQTWEAFEWGKGEEMRRGNIFGDKLRQRFLSPINTRRQIKFSCFSTWASVEKNILVHFRSWFCQ